MDTSRDRSRSRSLNPIWPFVVLTVTHFDLNIQKENCHSNLMSEYN